MISSPWMGRGVVPPAVVGVEWPACRRVAPWRERREDYLAINRQLHHYPLYLCTVGTGRYHKWP